MAVFLMDNYMRKKESYASLEEAAKTTGNSSFYSPNYESPQRQKVKSLLLSYFIVVAMLATISGTLSSLLLNEKQIIEKPSLQKTISTLISNDGDLRAVKQALKNSPKNSKFLDFGKTESHYPHDVALSTVLDDLRVSAYLTGEKNLVEKIDLIIKEHEEINPFDQLPINQRDYFENIRIKSGDSYSIISNDVNNLVDELYEKNKLVDEYLADSNMSFLISVFGLVLSIIISGYQIFSSRESKTKDLLIKAFKEIDTQLNEKRNA